MTMQSGDPQSANLQSVNLKSSAVRFRPVIRVFVSSTVTDLKHERDALQQLVFPKLEQIGTAYGRSTDRLRTE